MTSGFAQSPLGGKNEVDALWGITLQHDVERFYYRGPAYRSQTATIKDLRHTTTKEERL